MNETRFKILNLLIILIILIILKILIKILNFKILINETKIFTTT